MWTRALWLGGILSLLQVGCTERSETDDDAEPAQKKKRKKKKKKKKKKGKTVSPKAGRHPGDALVATLDGKGIEMTSAVALSRGGRALEVFLANYPLECDEAAKLMQPFDRDELVMWLTVSPALRRTGKEETVVSYTFFRGSNSYSDHGAVKGTSLDPAKPVALTLPKLALTSADTSSRSTFTLEGAMQATGCGPYPPKAAARPQPSMKLTVAGKVLPIAGAVLEKRSGYETLRLATDPFDCTDGGTSADLVWELVLDVGTTDVDRAQMRGRTLTKQSSTMFPAVTVTRKASSSSTERFELKGVYDHVGYEVHVDGRVDALVCP